MRILLVLAFLFSSLFVSARKHDFKPLSNYDTAYLCNINCTRQCQSDEFVLYCDSIAYINGHWEQTVENLKSISRKDYDSLRIILNNPDTYKYLIKRGDSLFAGSDVAAYTPTVALIVRRKAIIEQLIIDPSANKYLYFVSQRGKTRSYPKETYHRVSNQLNSIFKRNGLSCLDNR
ncbi:hypothetical protein [Taibaiella helva]|uniref:hypothetical protein n=1 Tax=Taibaiella helva TaxID=2301235 RepID=UPI00130081DB|nr:hypothetical protein [Taibaiella helva]